MRLIRFPAFLVFLLALVLAAEARDGFLQCGYHPCGSGAQEEEARLRARYPMPGKYCMTPPAVTGVFKPICSFADVDSCTRVIEQARARQTLSWLFPAAQ